MEENQHHTDLKYFDFLHHDDKSNRDTIFSSEKNKYTSNGGGVGNINAFDERFDDDDDDDDDDGDNINEPVFKQQSRRINYEEPDYATVDLKKKSDDRVKTNGLTTGSNIMGKHLPYRATYCNCGQDIIFFNFIQNTRVLHVVSVFN
jgi:hypothetical protein